MFVAVHTRAQTRRSVRRWLSLMPPREAYYRESAAGQPQAEGVEKGRRRRAEPEWVPRNSTRFVNPAKLNELRREIDDQILLNRKFKSPAVSYSIGILPGVVSFVTVCVVVL